MDKPYLILGLDIGIASCGWALLDTANHRIVDMGVHLWDAPQKKKQSLAAIRRAARSSRRNTKRAADRAKHCVELFIKYGLIPDHANKAWMQTVKGDPQPLESRVAALDGLIDNRHLAQALYNISLRRGYIPHGESADDNDTEGKKILSALSENEEAMAENGWRTVGEMMLKRGRAEGARCGKSRNHGGDYSRCVRMSQLVDEANAIIEAQRAFGNELVTEEFQIQFVECMTWEKDILNNDARIYDLVTDCVYFPGEKAAAKACLSFEMCQAFERVNNIRIVGPGGQEQSLPPETKRWVVDMLFAIKPRRVTYSKLRTKMDLSAHLDFKGISRQDENRTDVSAAKVWKKLCSKLPEGLVKRMHDDLEFADEISSALTYAHREDSLRNRLKERLSNKLTEAETEAICTLPFTSKEFSGYGTRSAKALRKLIKAFQAYDEVESLADAVRISEMKEGSFKPFERGYSLPPYEEFDPTCKNPVVLRVMARVRKVVNAIICEYGMPNKIHVELARELKQSEKEKKQIRKSDAERKRARDIARKWVSESKGIDEDAVPEKLIRMKILWDEQDGLDLYLKESIDPDRMINDQAYCQIDHILPYSRTCDNSQSNKILVLAKSNQDKKERSPYEWLQPLGEWEAFEARIRASQKIPYKKRVKLLEPDLKGKEEGFIKRNMNDTRYATRAALNYIDRYLAFPEDGNKRHAYAVAGAATFILRGAWGFAAKDRDKDDCHHAVDAAVVAACGPATVMAIAKASEKKHRVKKEKRRALFKSTEPWEGFVREVQGYASELIPTRRVEHGGSARLFEDFTYRYLGLSETGSKALIGRHDKGEFKISPTSNVVVRTDGSAKLPDGMLLLRLWWDGKKYLKEPIYYSDLAALHDGSYVPRYHKQAPRAEWPVVPDELIKKGNCIELRAGDAVLVGDELLRYGGFDIDGGKFVFKDVRKFKGPKVSPKEKVGKAKAASFLQIVNEDVLGLCYRDELKTSESSEPQDRQLRFGID